MWTPRRNFGREEKVAEVKSGSVDCGGREKKRSKEGSAMKEDKKNKHLTLDDRIAIEKMLDQRMTFKEIGKYISKDASTVSKEVKRHLIVRPTNVKRYSEDGTPLETPCRLLLKAPYVCNGCEKRSRQCSFNKQIYLARKAQQAYEKLRTESRTGVTLNKEAFWEMDDVLAKGVSKGQHIYHILQNNDLGYSQSSVYRLLKQGYLSCSALDLPRYVKFRKRKPKTQEYVPSACKQGRTHDDFLAYIAENDISDWVEMDTVIGRPGGKVIVTFDFTACNFMFGLLAENKTSDAVSRVILDLKRRFEDAKLSFGSVFSLLLTDNGGEFSNFSAFEKDKDGNREARLFYCDPMRSCQKPRVEKNHTLFRDIVPKGSSFDALTQEQLNTIFSHVNCVSRKIYGGKTPYELFCFCFGQRLAELLGIRSIPPEDVIQSPKLLEQIR